MGEHDAHMPLTDAERKQAIELLDRAKQNLHQEVAGLSEAQLGFKPGADQWSIAETLEHITVIQEAVVGIATSRIDGGMPAAEGRDTAWEDAQVMAAVPDRSRKFQAPPPVLPSGRWSPAQAMVRYDAADSVIRGVLEHKTGLRARFIPHPALGPWDGYQWILGGACHTARHTEQIREIKAAAGYPG